MKLTNDITVFTVTGNRKEDKTSGRLKGGIVHTEFAGKFVLLWKDLVNKTDCDSDEAQRYRQCAGLSIRNAGVSQHLPL